MDIAKNVFQAHGVDAGGKTTLTRQLRRGQVIGYFEKLPPCLVGIEACATGHHWARELTKLGHTVRLMPASYVKAYVKRSKNDAADAAAICEAVTRPSMRFVPVKTIDQQAALTLHRCRDLLIRQRTQLINALRGLAGEYGWVTAKGHYHVTALMGQIEDPSCALPAAARDALLVLVKNVRELNQQIDDLDAQIARRARQDEDARRLMTIPCVGQVVATAILALAPPPQTFGCGRDFAAWMGLTPEQESTGGKEKLGKITRMGDRTLRRLLIIGAASVVRQALIHGAPEGSWLARMLARKPRMLVIVALANKTARIIWALLAKGGVYKAPAVAA